MSATKNPAQRRRRRPPKPKRRASYSNIYPRWMASADAWGWRPAIKHEGSLIWGPTVRTQKEAFEAAQQMRSELATIAELPDVSMTISEAFDETIQRLLDGGGSPITAKGYRARFDIWEDFLDPEAPIAQFTADDVRALIRRRRERDGLHANGVRQDLRVLHRVLAVGGFPPDKNPARKRTKELPGGVDWPAEKQPDRPFFTMAQVADIERRVRKSATPSSTFHADLIVFLAVTGIRSFELERLRAHDVSFDDEQGGGTIKVHGKRGGIRRVAFHAGDKPIVRRLLEHAGTGPIISPVGLSTILKRLARRLGIPGLNARALRRTFATDMSDGSDLRTIQSQLGHSQLSTTQKYLGERIELAHAAAERRHRRLRGSAQEP